MEPMWVRVGQCASLAVVLSVICACKGNLTTTGPISPVSTGGDGGVEVQRAGQALESLALGDHTGPGHDRRAQGPTNLLGAFSLAAAVWGRGTALGRIGAVVAGENDQGSLP